MNVKFERGGDAGGTSLLGHIAVPYSRLVAVFGPPEAGDGDKTDAEWVITFYNGVVAAVYNWKNGPAYCGAGGTSVEEIQDWHVGGKVREALWLVEQAIGGEP